MKKVIAFMLVLANILSMLACSVYIQDSNEYDPHKYNPQQEAMYNEETLKEILKCFDNKDIDSLIEMFSEAVKSQYDLESQIEKAFEIYSGESVSYEGFWDSGYSSLDTNYGICVQKSVRTRMNGIKTTNNEIFDISIIKCILDDSNPDNLGLKSICLIDSEYGNLAIIGQIRDFQKDIFEENIQKRNSNKSSDSNAD